MIVDRAIYRDGRRLAEPRELAGMGDACRDKDDVGWVALYRPTEQEFADVVREFDLPRRSVDDAVRAHQRPKLERYDETLFCVLRAARYIDATETVEFSELQVFAAGRFVVTVRHGDAPDLPELRRSLESRPEVLRRGPTGILHAIIERVVDDYRPVVTGIENDIDEIEESVFGGKAEVSRRVYELSREVISFQRATRPLAPMLERLMAADRPVGEEERMHLGDVQDHALRVVEQADSLRQLLQNILNVNLTLETKALNENVQRAERGGQDDLRVGRDPVRADAGRQRLRHELRRDPELRWRFGYAFAIALMVAVAATLYLLFRRRNWI